MKPGLYLAGGINGLSDEEVFGWRREVTGRLSDHFEIHDPSLRDYRGMEAQNVNEIVTSDLDEIMQCGALIVFHPKPSTGTDQEMVYAKLAGKYIVTYGAGDRPSPWLLYHSSNVVPTLDLAIAALIGRWRTLWKEVN